MSWCSKEGSSVKTGIHAITPKNSTLTADGYYMLRSGPLAPVSRIVQGTKSVTYPVDAASFRAKMLPSYYHW